jgi:hypothetical protein
MDTNSKYIIQPRSNLQAKLVTDEDELFQELELTCKDLSPEAEEDLLFPETIDQIKVSGN